MQKYGHGYLAEGKATSPSAASSLCVSCLYVEIVTHLNSSVQTRQLRRAVTAFSITQWSETEDALPAHTLETASHGCEPGLAFRIVVSNSHGKNRVERLLREISMLVDNNEM